MLGQCYHILGREETSMCCSVFYRGRVSGTSINFCRSCMDQTTSLGIWYSISVPTLLLCDNASAISLAYNPVLHSKNKHIDIDVHYIRDCAKTNSISLKHISSSDQLADILTKPLSNSRFQYLTSKLLNLMITQFEGG